MVSPDIAGRLSMLRLALAMHMMQTAMHLFIAGLTMIDAYVQYFIELTRHRSMAQAADDLAVSQSTKSRAIQRLEARFGVEPIERTSRGVALTDAGNRLIARLESAVSYLQDAQHEHR